jgi:myo-inositol 2-dehydrogenase/D-chiro-inositol 1-dehydrogenase
MRRIPIGVIGAGRIGRMHAENLVRLLPEAEVLAIYDPTLDSAWASELGIPRHYADVAELLADPDLAAVAIAAPSPHHADLVVAAAAAGKHVFCEKPLAFDAERALAVAAAGEAAGVVVQIGFNRRFDADMRQLAHAVRGGEIGPLHTLQIVNRDPALPSFDFLRTSGGILFDFSIHDFDMARFASGDEIDEVYVRGAALVEPRLAEIGDADSVVITLRLRGGALVGIVESRQSCCGYDQRLEALGLRGSLRVENPRRSVLVRSDVGSVTAAKPPETFAERYRDAYVAQLRAFFAAVDAGRPAEVGPRDAAAAIVAARAAQRSLDERRPVRLAEMAPGVAA